MPGTYVDSLVAAPDRAGDRPAVRRDGRDTTGRELLSTIHRYARALDRLGADPGRLVGLSAPSRPDVLALRSAANLIGAASVCLPARAAEPPFVGGRFRTRGKPDQAAIAALPRPTVTH
jgi:fatty-acyl-CoA synthase